MRAGRRTFDDAFSRAVRWWSDIAGGVHRPEGASAVAVGLLVMLSVPYGVVSTLVQWLRAARSEGLDVPVISVGNLVVGGTGKTPLTIYLARRLKTMGLSVAIVSRGYGRLARRLVVVSEGGRPLVGWEDAGDEPVLAAMVTTGVAVVVGRDRVEAARHAVDKLGADAILVDDGFQHVRLWRDLDLVAVDAMRPVGNGHLLPAGTLREHPAAVRRAGVIVATRCRDGLGASLVESTVGALAPEVPVVATQMRPAEFWHVGTGRAVKLGEIRSHRCLALSSIARPRDFEQTLSGLGIDLVGSLSFPDHHRYSEADHAAVLADARSAGADMLLTTEKDAVRLAAWRPPLPLVALGIEIEILSGGDVLDRAIAEAVRRGGGHGA